MMDVEAAKAAMSQINVGDMVTGALDGVPYTRKVVDKTAYSVTLQGPTNKITVPVETTDFYQQEIAMRVPANTAEPKAGRGRPKRVASAAPVEQPQPPQANTFLPPGSSYGGTVAPPVALQPQGGLAADVERAEKAARIEAGMTANPPQQMTIQQAENDPNWAETSMEEAFDTLREHFATIIEGVRKDAEEKQAEAAPVAAKKTCWQCVYVNQVVGNCSKFNMVPPMHVIVEPEKHCPEFMFNEEIPY